MGKRKTRKSREEDKKGEKQKKRMGVKKKRLCYPKENVALALQDIRTGKTIAECSRLYNIPESTIRAKKLGIYADKKPGPSSVLSEEEEKQLVDWIFECCKKGFPVTKPQLVESVKIICENLKKKNPFRDNKPGRSWYEAFLKRNPEISERISENVSLNRAKVSKQSLRSWFEEVSEYLIDQDLITIEPNKIFNCDETGIPLNPKPPSVLAPKGYKTVYSVVDNNEKENVTVLIIGNATGDIAPTFILFTGKSLPDNASAMAPKDFAFGCSENGWMTAKIFFEYIANVFEPWLTKMKIKRPVLMYMDGHSSHMTLHLSKFCSDNGIVLVALHANATHILQPLDIAFFRTLKIQWQKIYKTFCENSSSIGIHKYQFAPVLKKTLDSMDIVKILENGFKKCGLYPFDIDAIDFNKILCRKQNQSIDSVTESDSDMVQNDIDKLKVLESLLSADKLESFKMNTGIVWRGVEKDESLFELWYQLSHPSDTPSVTDQNTTDVVNDPEVTSETRDGI